MTSDTGSGKLRIRAVHGTDKPKSTVHCTRFVLTRDPVQTTPETDTFGSNRRRFFTALFGAWVARKGIRLGAVAQSVPHPGLSLNASADSGLAWLCLDACCTSVIMMPISGPLRRPLKVHAARRRASSPAGSARPAAGRVLAAGHLDYGSYPPDLAVKNIAALANRDSRTPVKPRLISAIRREPNGLPFSRG